MLQFNTLLDGMIFLVNTNISIFPYVKKKTNVINNNKIKIILSTNNFEYIMMKRF